MSGADDGKGSVGRWGKLERLEGERVNHLLQQFG